MNILNFHSIPYFCFSFWALKHAVEKAVGKKYNLTIDKLNITKKLFCMSEKLFYIQSWKTLTDIFPYDDHLGTEKSFKIALSEATCRRNTRVTLCHIVQSLGISETHSLTIAVVDR